MSNSTDSELIAEKLDVFIGQFDLFLDDMENIRSFLRFLRSIIIITIIILVLVILCGGVPLCCGNRVIFKRLNQNTPILPTNQSRESIRTTINSPRTLQVSTRNPQVHVQP
jgi:hypothetical protein